jgi:hypothetical protein
MPIHYSETKGCFFGYVVNQAGVPVEKAFVDLKNSVNSTRQLTDKNGRFVFENLNPGSYLVRVGAHGFIAIRADKSIEVTPNQAVYQMFQLQAPLQTDGLAWAVHE